MIFGQNVCLTLVQPVAEPVEDDVLFARRHQADRAAAHRGAIVDVVLKDEDLKNSRNKTKDGLISFQKAFFGVFLL